MPTWSQRRAATRQRLATCTSKDKMVDILGDGGYMQDPMWSGLPLSPKSKRQKEALRKLHQAWGVEDFYERRRRGLENLGS